MPAEFINTGRSDYLNDAAPQPSTMGAEYEESTVNDAFDNYRSVDPSPEFNRICAELDDDPNLRVHQLTKEEQAKLTIRAIACEHTDVYAPSIANTVGSVDYYIEELVLDGHSVRREHDLLVNAIAQGIAVEKSSSSGDPVPVRARLLRPTDDFVASDAYRQAYPTPILRSMDVTSSDPLPAEEVPHLPNLLSNRQHPDMGNLESTWQATEYSLYEGADFDSWGPDRREAMRTLIELGAIEFRIRNRRQIDDISVIAANAVRRHPEMDHVTVAVVQGRVHREVIGSLTEDTGVMSEIIDIPPVYEEPMYTQATTKMAATGEMPADEVVDRALFDHFTGSFIRQRYGSKHAGLVNSTFYKYAHEYVTQGEVARFLKGLDSTTTASHMGATGVTAADIYRLLCEIPVMAELVVQNDNLRAEQMEGGPSGLWS